MDVMDLVSKLMIAETQRDNLLAENAKLSADLDDALTDAQSLRPRIEAMEALLADIAQSVAMTPAVSPDANIYDGASYDNEPTLRYIQSQLEKFYAEQPKPEPRLPLDRDDVLRIGSLIHTARDQNIFDWDGTVTASMYMHLFEAFLQHECGVDGSVPASTLLAESEG